MCYQGEPFASDEACLKLRRKLYGGTPVDPSILTMENFVAILNAFTVKIDRIRTLEDRLNAMRAKQAELQATSDAQLDRIRHYEQAIQQHNTKNANIPQRIPPQSPSECLRLIAKWMDDVYGGAGTGKDIVQQDCRRFADEVESQLDRIRKLEALIRAIRDSNTENPKPLFDFADEFFPDWCPPEGLKGDEIGIAFINLVLGE